MECLQNKEGDWNDTGSNDIWRGETAGSAAGNRGRKEESNGFQTADNSENDWKGISHRGDYVPGVWVFKKWGWWIA